MSTFLACLLAVVLQRAVDGDTVVLQVALPFDLVAVRTFRLEGLCAPELRAPGGREAKTHLEGLLAGHRLALELRPGQSFERLIGRLSADGQDVTERMIADGFGVAAVGSKCP